MQWMSAGALEVQKCERSVLISFIISGVVFIGVETERSHKKMVDLCPAWFTYNEPQNCLGMELSQESVRLEIQGLWVRIPLGAISFFKV